MSKIVLKQLRGINSSKASFQLQAGDTPVLQNLRARPFQNWAKRKGIEPVAVQTTPVLGIFDLELDPVVIPLWINGGTFTFFPDYGSESFPTPDPHEFEGRTSNSLDPYGVRTLLFLVEPTMRAIQERRLRAGLANCGWPKAYYNGLGVYNGAGTSPAQQNKANYYSAFAFTADFPVNNFYQYDLAWTDQLGNADLGIAAGSPTGTYATYLINLMVAQLDTANSLPNAYLNTDLGIQGQTDATVWTNVTLPKPSSATTATYRSRFVDCKAAVRRLTTIVVTGSTNLTQVFTRNYTGTTGSVSCAAVKATTLAAVNSVSYVGGGSSLSVTFYTYDLPGQPSGEWSTYVVVSKCPVKCDLTNYVGPGTTATYLRFTTVPGLNGSPIAFGQLQLLPFSPVQDLYSLWSGFTPTIGISSTSTQMSSMDNAVVDVGTCPLFPSSDGSGFQLNGVLMTLAPNMTYNV